MSRGSADKTYAKRKRQPYETSTRERAYQIAAREAVSGSGSRAKQLLEEAEVATCQVVEDLDQQPMLKTMGEQKERPSPLN
jgi:hypothetical protein